MLSLEMMKENMTYLLKPMDLTLLMIPLDDFVCFI